MALTDMRLWRGDGNAGPHRCRLAVPRRADRAGGAADSGPPWPIGEAMTERLNNHSGRICRMPEEECPCGPCKCRDAMGLGYVTKWGYRERLYALEHGISREEAK